MKDNSSQKGNVSTLKSMVSMAFYLLLLIGVWAIIGYLVFPDRSDDISYAALVPANEPLLSQIAENVIDPEQWAGIQQTAEVQTLLEKPDANRNYKNELDLIRIKYNVFNLMLMYKN